VASRMADLLASGYGQMFWESGVSERLFVFIIADFSKYANVSLY
jgi:hypothetical protein